MAGRLVFLVNSLSLFQRVHGVHVSNVFVYLVAGNAIYVAVNKRVWVVIVNVSPLVVSVHDQVILVLAPSLNDILCASHEQVLLTNIVVLGL